MGASAGRVRRRGARQHVRPVVAATLGLALLVGCTGSEPSPATTDRPEASGPPTPTASAIERFPAPAQCTAGSPGVKAAATSSTVVDRSEDVGRTWAGMYVGQSLLTTETDQYVAYYDPDRVMTIAQRKIGVNGLPVSGWTHRALDSTLGWDSHNYVTLAVDRDNALHVSGNMHGTPLEYFRTQPGGNIDTLARVPTMVENTPEDRVTYPVFLRQGNGGLFFYYRDGGSGDGSTFMNRYDEKSKSWSSVVDGQLFDGNGSTQDPHGDWNAYQTQPTFGPDGFFHMLWVWRDTPDVATNSVLTYARTKDFVQWYAADGTPLTLPFRHGEGDVVDPVPSGGGLVNGLQAIGFGSRNRVVVTYSKYDAHGNVQLWAAEPDEGGDWRTHQLTTWDNPMEFEGTGTLSIPFGVAGAEANDDGTLSIEYSCHGARQTLTVDESFAFVSQSGRAPVYPRALTDVRGNDPALGARVAVDLGESYGFDPKHTYVLRWETLGTNHDEPRETWPKDGTALTVALLEDPRGGEPKPFPETHGGQNG